MSKAIGPDEKPPVGGMGGSIHDWKRGIDPFHPSQLPEDIQELMPKADGPPAAGWMALDAVGNEIGFLPDGTLYPERPNTIEWTRPSLERFKKEYNKHKDHPEETFKFEGNEYLVNYAKYLIEYLETRIPQHGR